VRRFVKSAVPAYVWCKDSASWAVAGEDSFRISLALVLVGAKDKAGSDTTVAAREGCDIGRLENEYHLGDGDD
jgi:hypothetical protein